MERGWPSGPRLPATPRKADPDELLADPAKGNRVDRCLTCGMPSSPGGKLMTFDLLLAGRRAGRYRLCERCWLFANPATPVDPLSVPDAA